MSAPLFNALGLGNELKSHWRVVGGDRHDRYFRRLAHWGCRFFITTKKLPQSPQHRANGMTVTCLSLFMFARLPLLHNGDSNRCAAILIKTLTPLDIGISDKNQCKQWDGCGKDGLGALNPWTAR